jgi:hypothetical protein
MALAELIHSSILLNLFCLRCDDTYTIDPRLPAGRHGPGFPWRSVRVKCRSCGSLNVDVGLTEPVLVGCEP